MNYANESERRSNLTGLTTRCLQKCRSIIINFFLPYTVSLPFKTRKEHINIEKSSHSILRRNVVIFNNIIDLFTLPLKNNRHPTHEYGSYVGIAGLISNDNSLIARRMSREEIQWRMV